MRTYVILGTDEHARAVQGALVGMHVPVVCFNSQENWKSEGCTTEMLIKPPGCHPWLHPDTASALYWRSYDGVTAAPGVGALNRQSVFESWLKGLENEGVPMFNSYSAWQDHRTKPYHMGIVQSILDQYPHITVPNLYYGFKPTIYSSRERYVLKAPQGGTFAVPADSEFPEEIEPCWQRYVAGNTYRFYGTHKGSWESYQLISKCVDYRQDPDVYIRRLAPPEETVAACLDLIKQIGWRWAGIDLIIEDGITYILDVNPSPMFLGFQRENELLVLLVAAMLEDGR